MAASKGKLIIWGAVGVVVVVAAVALLIPPAGTVTNVDSAGLREALAQGATMLDVRTQGEYEASHIPGAVLVDYATFGEGVAELPKDKPYIVYCASGSRSAEVVSYMEGQGFVEIYHLNQGLVSWDGSIATGQEPGDVAAALGGSAAGPSESMLAQALKDPLIAPSDLPVMVEFSSDDWPTCVTMGPIVEALKVEYAGKVDVRPYNINSNQAAYSVLGKLGGTGVPEFYFINTQGQLVDRIIGGASEQEIRVKLDALK